ncbi:hypothetical protein ACFY2H_37385 [Streptomyces griseofuscus]|uniref:hypothetical protein n=1 Tax=Streptomyces griseofuscus TaxID=146922 RepID=UPI0036A7DB61
MATLDRPSRLGFASIPALGAGLLTIYGCALLDTQASPWAWLAGAGGGAWGYWYSSRWATSGRR